MKITPRGNFLALLLMVLQLLGMVRVLKRLLPSAQTRSVVSFQAAAAYHPTTIGIIVPVLNEVDRLLPCLESLQGLGPEVVEMLFVDGGSRDGTQELVHRFQERESRARLIDASPVPVGWNGKTWGMYQGVGALRTDPEWVLFLDADVSFQVELTPALLQHAQKTELSVFSIATQQVLGSLGEGFIHPSFLTTLIYRYGIPGRHYTSTASVQANGQCFFCKRTLLEEATIFQEASQSLCEDMTMARFLVQQGQSVGFFESEQLISTRMYTSGREVWRNWSRSLPTHDHYAGLNTWIGWLEVCLLQALPLPIWLSTWRSARHRSLWRLNSFLLLIRLGILLGSARAYPKRPWSYWLSPLCDLPSTIQLARMTLRKRHQWRGQSLERR